MQVSSIIKSPIARRIAATAMLLGASVGVTKVSANNNNSQIQASAKTEFVSKEAAQAINSYIIAHQNTQGPIRQLASMHKYYDKETLTPHLSSFSSTYKDYGELAGVAYESYVLHALQANKVLENIKKNYYIPHNQVIVEKNGEQYHYNTQKIVDNAQQEIDEANKRAGFEQFKPLNDTKEKFEQRYAQTDKLLTAYYEFCFSELANLIYSKASFQEYIASIDSTMAKASKELGCEYLISAYNRDCESFEKQQKTQGIQKQVDLLAYKMWRRDSYISDYIFTTTQIRKASVCVLANEINLSSYENHFGHLAPKPNP